MKFYRAVGIFTLIGASWIGSAWADTAATQTPFIRISQIRGGEGALIHFEKCRTADSCERIGTRDYSIAELKQLHSQLTTEAANATAWNALDVLEVLGGVVVGAPLGCLTGTQIAGLEGCGVGIVVGGVSGGVTAYFLIRDAKQTDAEELHADASEVSSAMTGAQPVDIRSDVEEFSRMLAEALGRLPAN